MTYRKKTLRTMLPRTRQLARIINDAESAVRRLKNFVDLVSELELDSRALHRMASHPTMTAEEALGTIRRATHDE